MTSHEPQALILRDKLTASEAAEELGVSGRRLRKLCQQGRIGALYVFAGREFYLIDRKELEAFKKVDRPVGRPPRQF